MGLVFLALLPLPGLLAATAFLGGLSLLLVLHARRERPWRPVLVRAGAGLVTMWIAITLASIALVQRVDAAGPLDGPPGTGDAAGWLIASFVLGILLLLAIAGGLLAWVAAASRTPGARDMAGILAARGTEADASD